jgi:membrane-bound lytic murein transglycosylase MltF
MLRNGSKQAVAALVCLLFPLLQCGGDANGPCRGERTPEQTAGSEQKPADQTPQDLATFPLAAHLNEKYEEDLTGLLDMGRIRVLTTFNKTNFFISGSQLHGFEYSLLHDYGKALNEQRGDKGLKVVMEFIPVPRDQLTPRLKEGLGDIAAAGLTITPERQKQVDFTDPYLKNVAEVVVTNRKTRNIRTLEDLSGRNVYVRKSSSYHESLLALNRRFSEAGRPPVNIIKVDESLETGDILEMVNAGALPITIADDIVVKIWSDVFDDLRVHPDLKVRTGSQIAWMVRKGSPELRKSLNAFLKNYRKGTRMGNIYFKRYFEHNKWIKNPLTKKEIAKQLQFTELFKKYGEKYGFDWMLIMALAYQESGLDNHKQSPTGAVGIMQVLPATASDKQVNIPNVHTLENNVHAGTKYLAFLRDRYFDDDRIDDRNRIRFSLAAYNAGPEKIRKAQKLAQEMGMDRYRWFRNVEVAASRAAGQGTVQYVSNINKYYVLFKLYEETEKLRESSKHGPLAKPEPQ